MDFSVQTLNFSQTFPSSSETSSILRLCFWINFSCFLILSFETPIIETFNFQIFLKLEKSIASIVHPGVSSLG